MENSSCNITEVKFDSENRYAELKLSMENHQHPTELRLILGNTPAASTNTTINELKLNITINKEIPKATSFTRPATYIEGEIDLELKKILVNNWLHCIGYTYGCTILVFIVLAISLPDSVKYGLVSLIIGIIFVIFFPALFANAGLGGRLEALHRRGERWLRRRLVLYFLLFHWNTHYRVRKLLQRIKEKQIEKEKEKEGKIEEEKKDQVVDV